jgi:predicted transcriptional regulator
MNKEKETKLIMPESFVTIQGWMVTHLKLKSNELMIYAIIYGFCQIRGQVFSGSVRYLAEWTNSTKRGVYKNLKSLVDKGLIEKIEENINGVKFCQYTICENRLPSRTRFCSPVMNKVHQGDEQSSPGGDEQSSPNNIDIDNIDNNIDIKKESKKERKEPERAKENVKSFNELIDNYTPNEQLRKELKEHLKVRKNKKAALTNRAIELSLKKLDDLASNDAEKIQMVQNAIMSGWTTFYPLKKDEKKKMGRNPSYDLERYKKSVDVFESMDEYNFNGNSYDVLSEFKISNPRKRREIIDIEVTND